MTSAIDDLSVLVLTLNEAPNLQRTLDSVAWAGNIVIVDSGSTDETLAIAQSFARTKVLQRNFTSHAEQWNFGLDQVATKWTLAIDADYVFPAAARQAVETAMQGDCVAYRADFDYLVYGRKVRGSILPPRTVLFQTQQCNYWQDGHTQRLRLTGKVGELPFKIGHDDRKPLPRWLQSQVAYARQEANKLLSQPVHRVNRNDRVRKAVVLAPMLVFLMVYLFRGGFLSGWRGLFYALQRFTAEVLLSLFLLDEKLQSAVKDSDAPDKIR
jgi:hypothetical protein